jgi:carboxymethylenebutenolidase
VLTLVPLLLFLGCNGGPAPPAVPEPVASVEEVKYRPGKEPARGLLHRPAGKGPFPALVVVHGDFGPTAWVRDQAQRLADRGYVALAVDLYRGEVVTDLMEAHIMDRGLPEDRVLADLKAAVDYLAGRPEVRGDAVGIIGWGMGGGYALDAALADPRVRAVVTCYGRLTTDAKALAPLNAAVLGVFGGKDEGIPPATIEQFRAAMKRAGKRLAGVHVYQARGHGFMDPTGPAAPGAAAAEATADAWGHIETFLAAELKP